MWRGSGGRLQTSSGGVGTAVKSPHLLTRLGCGLQELLPLPWRYWGLSLPGTQQPAEVSQGQTGGRPASKALSPLIQEEPGGSRPVVV